MVEESTRSKWVKISDMETWASVSENVISDMCSAKENSDQPAHPRSLLRVSILHHWLSKNVPSEDSDHVRR